MTYSKGFTRIWLAFSLAWIFGVICYHFDDIRDPKVAPHVYLYNQQNKSYVDVSGDPELFRKLSKNKNYETYDTAYREHYVYPQAERKVAIDAMLTSNLSEDSSVRKGQIDSARTTVIINTALYALVPIAALFALGLAAAWIFAGFKRSKPPKPLW